MVGRCLAAVTCGILFLGFAVAAAADESPPLALDATIELPNTSGRIDHLAIDLARKRLFVAELGNSSIDVVDLGGGGIVHRISRLDQPQGVVYVPKHDLLVVANGGDGTLRVFGANDFSLRGTIRLGDDADDLRLDPRGENVVVGYGSGHLAVVDPARLVNLNDIQLPEHPEGFQLSPSGDRAYVNVPDAHQIDVADLRSGKLAARWATPHLASNFPMALGDGGIVAVVFRSPPRLVRFRPSSGQVATANAACGDADDVFFDAKRQRYYVSCGAGVIDVFQVSGGAVEALPPVSTAWGARTSLFVPELDRLFVAVRAGLLGSKASIRIFRPVS